MRVAIAGYGLEGEISLLYWRALGADIAVFDEKKPDREVPKGIETYFGEDAFTKMDNFDFVIRTAGLNPSTIKSTAKIWSATNEFFAKCPAPIIGVTGTKGKGTTCTLITEILKAAGKTVHLVGNIGVPALERLSKIRHTDVVVYELSSFQLWDLEKSPTTAVVLMIEPDHMDVHSSMEEYVNAKANITTHQGDTDTVVYHPTNELSAEVAAKSTGKKVRYMTKEGAHLERRNVVIPVQAGLSKTSEASIITIDGNEICKTNEVGLIGPHNIENICAAITTAWEYTRDIPAIKSAVTAFTGLSHRLEFVREVDGVKYIDDSFSTGPVATLAALNSFDSPITLILGGSDKGISVTSLVSSLDSSKHKLIIIGAVAKQVELACQAAGFTNYIVLGDKVTMDEVVAEANKNTTRGGVVLLSPGHASFGMFKSYYDRGDQFKAAVQALQSSSSRT